MELKGEYKLTEAGVIPADWNVLTIDDLAITSSGTTPARAQADRYFSKGTIPWVKTLDLNNGLINETEEAVTETALAETCLQLYPAGCVLVAMYGGYNQIGRTGLLRISATVNQALTAIRPDTKRLHAGYLLSVLNFRNDYWRSVASSSRKDPNITSRDVRDFPIALPPTVTEQQAIAEALSDADALIESLKQLLTKKRQIKQGAMQELLTGKRRLHGFEKKPGYKQSDLGLVPKDWDVIPIGQIAQCLIGLTYSPDDVRSFGTLVLRSSNVQDGCLAFEDNVYVDMELPPSVITQEGDILICVRNGSRQLIGKCALINKAAAGSAFGAFMAVLRSKSSAYLFQQFQSSILKRQINDGMGATINQITNKDMAGFKVIWPTLETEQVAIAAILSDMDTEIDTLEIKLTKTRELKQGMMQELLTGRIRLV
ncbi:restriction endonuclease subunit S [soil metagenome]